MLQKKGYGYQFDPVITISILAFVLLSYEFMMSAATERKKQYYKVASVILFSSVLFFPVYLHQLEAVSNFWGIRSNYLEQSVSFLDEQASDQNIYFLSFEAVFPLTISYESQAVLETRFFNLWPLRGLIMTQSPEDVRRYPRQDSYADIEEFLYMGIRDDINKYEPKLLLVQKYAPVNIMRYLSRDPRLVEIFDGYKLVETKEVAGYWVYERR